MTHPVFFSSSGDEDNESKNPGSAPHYAVFTFVTGSFTFSLPIVGIFSLLPGRLKRWRSAQQQHPRFHAVVSQKALWRTTSWPRVSLFPARPAFQFHLLVTRLDSVSDPVQSSETHLNSPCAQTFIKSNLCIYRTESEEKTHHRDRKHQHTIKKKKKQLSWLNQDWAEFNGRDRSEGKYSPRSGPREHTRLCTLI